MPLGAHLLLFEQFFAYPIALQAGQIVHKQFALKVITFVLNTDSKEPLGFKFYRFAQRRARFYDNALGPCNGFVEPGH